MLPDPKRIKLLQRVVLRYFDSSQEALDALKSHTVSRGGKHLDLRRTKEGVTARDHVRLWVQIRTEWHEYTTCRNTERYPDASEFDGDSYNGATVLTVNDPMLGLYTPCDPMNTEYNHKLAKLDAGYHMQACKDIRTINCGASLSFKIQSD
jgi:hypothetical protein